MIQRSSETRFPYGALLLAVFAGGCATAPPPPPLAPVISFEQKMAWILQLEDRRILRTTLPAPAAPPIAAAKGRPTPPPPPPTSSPDLAVLVTDAEARVRRRAALAVGRVGLPDGVAMLVPLLADPDAEVRQMGAFALGLIGVALDDGTPRVHASLVPAVGPLTGALGDGDPLVRGRAAEALGQIGAREAADAIGKLAAEYGKLPAVASMQPDDEARPASPEADAFRLAIYALVRLRAYDPLAAAVLDPDGRPISRWWPVAYALQRIGDRRAAPALRHLIATPGRYTASFAARGLGALKEPSAAAPLLPLLDPDGRPLEVVVSAIRALAALGAREAVAPLTKIAVAAGAHPNLRLEAVTALGALRAAESQAVIEEVLSDPWPALRAAALRAASTLDREAFLLILSGLEPDSQWTVRAALADILGTLPVDTAVPRLREMLADEDKRVVTAVIGGLTRLRAPGLNAILLERLNDPDTAVREAAIRALGEVKPPEGLAALRGAFAAAQADAAYGTRIAALGALAEYGAAAADTLKDALADRDWAVRLRAAALLSRIDPGTDYRKAIRPAPGPPVSTYADPQLASPPLSPHAFIDTSRGTIEIELAMLDAPLTARNFIALASKGYFNGLAFHRVVPNFVIQDGDPRGDGGGGPGYTIRDELNMRPYVRGTVGMALSRRDDAGSQFFITHSPQPHLDARYTVFGHVVQGMDVVDRIQQGDIVERVRIWDGKNMK